MVAKIWVKIAALHPPHEQAIDEHARRVHEHQGDRDHGDERVQPERRAQPPRAEHAEHHELAVGEVDHLHQAPDDGQPDRDERVEQPHLEARRPDGLEE